MTHINQEKYVADVLSLKEKYKGKIQVLLGTEYDLLSDNDLSPFEYVIGSCHSFIRNGEYVSVDHSEATFVDCANRLYGGDYYAFVKDYFEMMSTAAEREEFTFYGHFDVINKFNPGFKLFDENDSRYKNAMLSALERLAKSGKPFELNTRCTFRHDVNKPSASAVCWLTALAEMKGQILINSDAHSPEVIAFNFDRAKEVAKSCGFNNILALTTDGFVEVPLK